MLANKSGTNWPFVVNLANSIIGVAVLAFPLCFKQCGVILGLILLLGCAWLAYTSCCLLAKSATVTKKRSYEYLAFYIFGSSGKLAVEICSVGLLLGTLITFFIIIGDICPEILSELVEIQNSTQLRTTVLLALGLMVILPLCMKSNLESISNLSIMSLVFYFTFSMMVVTSSLTHISTGEFITDVVYWDSSGIFRSLPIFALSYACQIQLFLVYHSTPDISINQIGALVSKAILLSSTVYFMVGYFGYLAFYDKEVSGDVLMNYETTFVTGLIKLGFVSSTILSFPLVVFPCRCSLYTLVSSKSHHENLGGTVHIPPNPFKYITLAVVSFTLTVGILVPKVEFMLGLVGSTLGSLICFVIPAVMFLRVVSRDTPLNFVIAKAVLVIGVTILILSTWATLHNADMKSHLVDLADANDETKPPEVDPSAAAPPGLANVPERNPPNSSVAGDVLKNNNVNQAKVVNSNLAGDLIRRNEGARPNVPTNEKANGVVGNVDKRDKIPIDGVLQDQKNPTEGNATAKSIERELDGNEGQAERVNMKKLLNLPRFEDTATDTEKASTTTTSHLLRDSTSPSSTSATKTSDKHTAAVLKKETTNSNEGETKKGRESIRFVFGSESKGRRIAIPFQHPQPSECIPLHTDIKDV